MCDEYERLTHARPHGPSVIHFFLSKDVPMDEKRGGGGDGTCSGILVVVFMRCVKFGHSGLRADKETQGEKWFCTVIEIRDAFQERIR